MDPSSTDPVFEGGQVGGGQVGNHLVADLGNRFLKLAVISGGDLLDRAVHPVGDALAGLTWTFSRHLDRVVYASVHPACEPAFEAWVRTGHGRTPEKIGRDVELPLCNRCFGVGTDRLVNALAAVRRHPGGAVAVDIGTAVTVDLVSPDPEFLGGAILPGPHLGALALADYAAQLPAVHPSPPEHPVGRATEEAIQSGIHHGVIGAVRELIRAYRNTVAFAPEVVFTGGDAEPYLDAFPGAHHVPNLTLEGIAACL